MKEIIVDIAGYILLGAIAVVILCLIADAFIRFVWDKWIRSLIYVPIANYIYCIRARYFMSMEDIIKFNIAFNKTKNSRIRKEQSFSVRLFRKILVYRIRYKKTNT